MSARETNGTEGRAQTGAGDLFREEALRYHLTSRVEGDVLRLPPAWTRWTYPFLLLSMAAMLAFLWLAPVREYADGPALVRDSVTAFLPARLSAQLHEGQILLLSSPGARGFGIALHVRSVGTEVLDPAEVVGRFARAGNAAIVLAEPVVVVSADLSGSAASPADLGERVGRARVVVSRERLLFALVPRLRRLAGS